MADYTTEQLARNLLIRLREVDSHITKSAYRALGPDEQDEVPTGDDYNLLFDAILDEIKAAIPQGGGELITEILAPPCPGT